jgi:glycine betaine/choline ABC-type transport system substrate-binding protein
MSFHMRLRALFALFAAAVLAVGVAACGDDDDEGGGDSGGGESASLIESNPDNEGVELTIGSKNFTEQFILGEIYAQALEAAGYTVNTDLNLGSERIALRSLNSGEVSGYPEYTSTALTSFFDVPIDEVPADADEAYEQTQGQFEEQGLVAFEPTPFADANSLGMLTDTAEELGVTTISDLVGQEGDLTLAGSPECRQRPDCLLGLQDVYGLDFGKFTPVDIGLRYEVLDNGDADASILFTSDAQLSVNEDKYVLLEDDQGVFPAGNVLFVASQEAADEAGEDFGNTIELVQGELTLEVMQELNARVDIDKEDPAAVAESYLRTAGYIE